MNKIYVVGIGPGAYEQMTVRAAEVLKECEVIVGYTVYVELVREYFRRQEMGQENQSAGALAGSCREMAPGEEGVPGKVFLATPMRQEVTRCHMAFEEAAKGRKTAMVCSGDAGIYGMAGLMYEIGEEYPQVELEIIPGVTAAIGGAAVLGAPMGHDCCLISLSDLLTPWEKIVRRLRLAAEADFVICLYNPSSKKRGSYLGRACIELLKYKPEDTVCGIVRNIARDGEEMQVLTLKELKETSVDMFSTVFVGNQDTKVINGKMVTPRGYRYERE